MLDLMSKNCEKLGDYNLSFKNIKERNIFLSKLPENNKFNKGKICNVAFIESLKDNFSNNYLFNDVDVYPESNNIINYIKSSKNKVSIQSLDYNS